jgi:hypothetical protein
MGTKNPRAPLNRAQSLNRTGRLSGAGVEEAFEAVFAEGYPEVDEVRRAAPWSCRLFQQVRLF